MTKWRTPSGGRAGRIVKVRDVATVSWGGEEERYLGRFSGQRAVFVTANMKDDENVFAVRDEIYRRVAAWQPTLPAGIKLERGFDQSRNVHHRLSRLGMDFALALGLVLVTLLPLGLRAATVVMISIPRSLAIGLSLLHFTGFSLNQLSIAGIVRALGLLVDDSIVVVENIARYLRAGYSRVGAAVAATDQIALAVLGCTGYPLDEEAPVAIAAVAGATTNVDEVRFVLFDAAAYRAFERALAAQRGV